MRVARVSLLALTLLALAPQGGAADRASAYQERACPPEGALSVSVRACEMAFHTSLDGRGCAADPCVATLAASATMRGLPAPKDVAVSLGAHLLCSGASTLAAAACDASVPLSIGAGCTPVLVTASGTAASPTVPSLRASIQLVHEYRVCRTGAGLDVALVPGR